jgi:hypothetical protein
MFIVSLRSNVFISIEIFNIILMRKGITKLPLNSSPELVSLWLIYLPLAFLFTCPPSCWADQVCFANQQ